MNSVKALKIDMPFTGAGTSPEADSISKSLFAAASPAIVEIKTEHVLGSGFVVTGNRIVTDAHCVVGAREISVVSQSGTNYKAKMLDLDDTHDLAVLEICSTAPVHLQSLPLGNSKSLRPDDRLFALGHPQGASAIFMSPGYFTKRLTQQDFYAHINHLEDCDPKSFSLTPKESSDLDEFKQRPLLSARVHIEHGNSGGPLIDESGKVVGVSDLGANERDRADTYYTPVENVEALLSRPEPKFKFKEEWQASPAANFYKSAWRQEPFPTAIATGAAGFIARKIGLRAEIASALGAAMLSHDLSELLNSEHVRDKSKFLAATTGDALMLSGGALSFLSGFEALQKSIGSVVPCAKWIAAGGLALRLGAEFVPNHLITTDVSRTNGDVRAPFRVDLLNLTPRSAAENSLSDTIPRLSIFPEAA